MTSIFDGYDEEYRNLASDISKKISEVALCEDQKGNGESYIIILIVYIARYVCRDILTY
jgi:hypothetical protein